MNFSLQNKRQIEKGLQLAASSVVASQGPQHSPISGLSNSNDDCYDPNMDQHFGAPLLVPPHQMLPHNHQSNHCEPLSNSIYEPLPDGQSLQTHESMKATYQHGLPTSLVKQPSGSGSQSKQHVHSYDTSGLIEADETMDESSSFFTSSIYDDNHNEKLVKPSQIKQRRRLNCKFIIVIL